MTIVVPRLSPDIRLMTYGRDEIGDVPCIALTDRTTPAAMTKTEAIISSTSMAVGLRYLDVTTPMESIFVLLVSIILFWTTSALILSTLVYFLSSEYQYLAWKPRLLEKMILI